MIKGAHLSIKSQWIEQFPVKFLLIYYMCTSIILKKYKCSPCMHCLVLLILIDTCQLSENIINSIILGVKRVKLNHSPTDNKCSMLCPEGRPVDYANLGETVNPLLNSYLYFRAHVRFANLLLPKMGSKLLSMIEHIHR